MASSHMADIYDKAEERSRPGLCAHDVGPTKRGNTRGWIQRAMSKAWVTF